MRKLGLLTIVALCLSVTSCSLYKKYEGPEKPEVGAINDTVSLPSWKDFLSDPLLQRLIDTALCNNTDLTVTKLRIRQAEENLKASRLAFFPSLSIGPSARINSYNIPVSLDWRIGPPGSKFARLHQAEAERVRYLEEGNRVKSALVADIAAAYCRLQMLDDENEIILESIDMINRALDIQKELLRNGNAYFTTVLMMENQVLSASEDINDNNAEILELERSICLMLSKPYSPIERSRSGDTPFNPPFVGGVPAQLLYKRPDVRVAEKDIEIAFYLTSEARSELFPSLVLGVEGALPLAFDAVLSGAQTIFANGELRARVNVSRIDQEIAEQQYLQTVITAVNEVNQALSDYDLACRQAELYAQQSNSLERTYEGLMELMKNGSVSYLEIIDAQDDLLDAKKDRCENSLKAKQAVIDLYLSLGGGAN